ncbi:hypothetical protein AYO44_07480 [Planctomycetaceae bacterium SCGC AG-212-F19]|nr:hypothetical protein AYO44_07480 [Planctomycetaceae bacterium SCGC AG-212-F19]
MNDEGPPLESLTRRLVECPADFLAEPLIGSAGVIHVAAVVADLTRDLGGPPLTEEQAAPFQPSDRRKHRNRLQCVLVGCWLLHDSWFRSRQSFAGAAQRFFVEDVNDLAGLFPASQLVTDPDRREEFVRLALKSLGLRPAGETAAQAQDRLTTLSSVERQRVIREAASAEERARKVREAMAKKAAEEAAAKYMRE